MLGSVCDVSVVIGPRSPEPGVLRFVQHRDFHHKYRMVDVADRSKPKNFPPGNLFLEVFEGGSGGRRVVRWDYTIVGAEASVSVPFSVWSLLMVRGLEFQLLMVRGLEFQLVWLPGSSGVGASGDCEVAGPVVVVG